MPKVSKGKKARQNNLSKATEALTLKRSQTNTPIPEGTPSELDSPTQTYSELEPTSLDDTPGSWDSLLGDELPDVECTELQDENEDEEDMELNSEIALASFAEFLVDAQAAAQKAEPPVVICISWDVARKKIRKASKLYGNSAKCVPLIPRMHVCILNPSSTIRGLEIVRLKQVSIIGDWMWDGYAWKTQANVQSKVQAPESNGRLLLIAHSQCCEISQAWAIPLLNRAKSRRVMGAPRGQSTRIREWVDREFRMDDLHKKSWAGLMSAQKEGAADRD
ncbi:hypothetical protein B0H17DRAFT_1177560 [Mycena rosella]|uniref:Uncharacterized protein n=1 Tax=Mycena rosella TaxID=1033263 RepID=A0AAD7GJP2_MYCRO|nr:hypothetical protein B0H17DRAFT_1177560 [Mycena rosella]